MPPGEMRSVNTDEELDIVLRAIAEPRRRAILSLIASTELPAGQIAEHFEVTRSAVSQHLRILKEAGLVIERRDGTRRLYRASQATLAKLRVFVEHFWQSGFNLAREAAEDAERKKNNPMTSARLTETRSIRRRGRLTRSAAT